MTSVRCAVSAAVATARQKLSHWRDFGGVAIRLMRLALAAAPVATVCHVFLTLTSVVVQLIWTILIGLIVGLVPAAVHDGISGAGGRHILGAVGLFATSYLVQNVISLANDTLRDLLVLRVQGLVRDRVTQAMLRYPTLDAVESETVQNWVHLAVAPPDGATLGQTAVNVVATTGRYAVILAYCCVLAMFSPVLSVGVGILVVCARASAMAIGFRYGNDVSPILPAFRQSDYLAELATARTVAKEARIFGLQQWLVDNYMKTRLGPLREIYSAIDRVYRPTLLRGAGLGIGMLAAYAWLVSAGLTGTITVGALVVYLTALSGIFGGVNSVDTPRAQTAHASLKALHDLERTTARLPKPVSDVVAKGPSSRGLSFSNVSFSYPAAGRPVFAGLNLELRHGESCAIVGRNGAGKTTLVKLLMGLYRTQGGSITIAGKGMDEVGVEAWRQRIAVIFQDFQTYAMTARDNVGFGSLQLLADDEALNDAAERAGMRQVIEGLPLGWETVLSREFRGGVDLSRGQWQRVALARALLAVAGGAEILVLDEPTANLDVRAEAEFFQRFLTLTSGLTTILISHRFATVRQAARIVVLENGQIAEDGSHEALMAREGSYAELYRLQAAPFEEPQLVH